MSDEASPQMFTAVFRVDDEELCKALNGLHDGFAKGPTSIDIFKKLAGAYAMAAPSPSGLAALTVFLAGFYAHVLVDTALGGLTFCNPTCDCLRCSLGKLYAQAESMDPPPSKAFLAYYQHSLKEAAAAGERPEHPQEASIHYEAMDKATKMIAATKDYWNYWRKPTQTD